MLDKKSYLIDAIRAWCIDAGLTPYIVFLAEGVRVPPSAIRDGTVTLNISPAATNLYCANSEAVAFDCRFGGVSYSLFIPMKNILGVFPKEKSEEGFFWDVEIEQTPKPEGPANIVTEEKFGIKQLPEINTDAVGTNGAKISVLPNKPKPSLSVVKKDT